MVKCIQLPRFPSLIGASAGRVAAGALALLMLASCAQWESSDGQAEAGPSRPTFVSLNPCTDAILLEIADPAQVLAISHYSHDPRSSSIPSARARSFGSTGGTVEEVIALDPDIVLAGSFLTPSSRQALSDLNIRVELFDSANEIEQSMAQIRSIGRLAGHADRAEDLIARIRQVLAANASGPAHKPIAAVLWQPGQIVPGEATLVSRLMEQTGFGSHSQRRGLGQADYLALEDVLADPPEVLLIAGAERAQLHPALSRLEGTRIESFDPSLLYCGGPTIIRAADRLARIRRSMR